MLRLALSAAGFVAMLLWMRAGWLAQKAMKLYLGNQKRLTAETETINALVKRLDPDALANQVSERIASRIRAEEKPRIRALIKELQELAEQMRTIAPAVRAVTQDENGTSKPRAARGGKTR